MGRLVPTAGQIMFENLDRGRVRAGFARKSTRQSRTRLPTTALLGAMYELSRRSRIIPCGHH